MIRAWFHELVHGDCDKRAKAHMDRVQKLEIELQKLQTEKGAVPIRPTKKSTTKKKANK